MRSGGHDSRRSPATIQRSRPDLTIAVGKISRPQGEGFYPCQPALPLARPRPCDEAPEETRAGSRQATRRTSPPGRSGRRSPAPCRRAAELARALEVLVPGDGLEVRQPRPQRAVGLTSAGRSRPTGTRCCRRARRSWRRRSSAGCSGRPRGPSRSQCASRPPCSKARRAGRSVLFRASSSVGKP